MTAPQKLTRSSCDALSTHLRNLARIPLLTHEEEITLARAVQSLRRLDEINEELTLRSGGQAPSLEALAAEAGLTPLELVRARRRGRRAKQRMVSANLRLVVTVARKYASRQLELEDLIQEGNIGLIKAVERFDHTRGYRFSTYASWWIRHAISRALADKGRAVRIPVHMLDTYNRVQRLASQMAARLGREPSLPEIATESGIALEKLERIQKDWAETPFSLDKPMNDEDGRRYIDFLQDDATPSPFEQVASTAWSDELRRLLDTLSPMEARIIRWRFGLDHEDELTLKEIGDKYNLSRERIRQLQEQALEKIRKLIRE
jgi:RNA polymerase primary sigma factor